MDEAKAAPMSDAEILLKKRDACGAAAHEVNRQYCLAIGDNSQVHWENAPSWQRDSVMMGVDGALSGNTPEQSHIGWMNHKRAEGWVYGEVKDPTAKTHPAFLDYADLPEAQRMKDELFLTTVRGMASVLGLPMQQRQDAV